MCKLVKARKRHVCVICGYEILKGELYKWERLAPWDGDGDIFFTYKAHQLCSKVFRSYGDEWDWYPESLKEDWDYLVSLYKKMGIGLVQTECTNGHIRKLIPDISIDMNEMISGIFCGNDVFVDGMSYCCGKLRMG